MFVTIGTHYALPCISQDLLDHKQQKIQHKMAWEKWEFNAFPPSLPQLPQNPGANLAMVCHQFWVALWLLASPLVLSPLANSLGGPFSDGCTLCPHPYYSRFSSTKTMNVSLSNVSGPGSPCPTSGQCPPLNWALQAKACDVLIH